MYSVIVFGNDIEVYFFNSYYLALEKARKEVAQGNSVTVTGG
jgi:hypothetical protein